MLFELVKLFEHFVSVRMVDNQPIEKCWKQLNHCSTFNRV